MTPLKVTNNMIFVNADFGLGKELYRIGNALSVGIKEPVSQASVSVYPNPAGNTIVVERKNEPGISHYTFFNMMGQEVLTGPLASQKDFIDVHSLPAGIYIVKVGGKESQIVKFIKE